MNINKFPPSRENYHKYLLALILIAGFILRFYNAPNRFGFDFDASRDGLTATQIAQTLNFPLLGSLSSATSLSSGPWYYYFLAIFEGISPLYGSWIMIGVFNLIFIALIYKIGEILEDKKFGLILATLVAFSPSQITLSNTLSNPSPIPVFASLAIIFFLVAVKKKKLYSIFLVGFLVGLGINIHYEMVGFIIFPVLILLFLGNRIRSLALLTLGFFLPFIPMIVYDLKNNWINFKSALIFLTSSHNDYYIPNRWLFYLRDFWPTLWANTLGVPLIPALLIIASVIFLIILLAYKRLIKREFLFIIIAFVVDVVQLRYFPQDRRIYYLYYLYPFIFIFSGFLVYKMYHIKKLFPFAIFLFALIILFMLKNDRIKLHSDANHKLVVSYEQVLLEKFSNISYNIYSCKENVDKGMGLTYLLNKKGKSKIDGKKIGFGSKNCGDKNSFKKIDDIYLYELNGSDSNLANMDWFSISEKSMEEIKNMQLYRSY